MSTLFELFSRPSLPPLPTQSPTPGDVAEDWLAQGLHLLEAWDIFQPGGLWTPPPDESPDPTWVASLLITWAAMKRVAHTHVHTESWTPCLQRIETLLASLHTATLESVLPIFHSDAWIQEVQHLSESYDDTTMLPSERAMWSRELLSEFDDAELLGYAIQHFLPTHQAKYFDNLALMGNYFDQHAHAFLEASTFIRVQSQSFKPDIDDDPDLSLTTLKYIRLLDLLEEMHAELSFQGAFQRYIPPLFAPLLPSHPQTQSQIQSQTLPQIPQSFSPKDASFYFQKIQDFFQSLSISLQELVLTRPVLPLFQPILGTGSVTNQPEGDLVRWKSTDGTWEASLTLPHPTKAADKTIVTLRIRNLPSAQMVALGGLIRPLQGQNIRSTEFTVGELRQQWGTTNLPTLVLFTSPDQLSFGLLSP